MRKRLSLTIINLILWSLVGSPARGDDVVVEHFHPAATSGGYITTEAPDTSGHLKLRFDLTLSLVNDPLMAVSSPFSTPVINYGMGATVSAGLGLGRFIEVGASMPILLYQSGPGVTEGTAAGDLQLHLKGRIWRGEHFSVGAMGSLWVPTGSNSADTTTGQVAFLPRILAQARVGWLRAGFNVGALIRQPGSLDDLTVSHELTYGLGVGLRPYHRVEILGDLYGSTALTSPFHERAQSPLEAVGAAAVHFGPIVLAPGAGAGVVNGYGAPAWRLFFSVRYEPERQQQPPPPQAPPPVEVMVSVAPPPRRPMELAPPEVLMDPGITIYRGNAEVAITDTELIPAKAVFFEVNFARIRREFYPVLDNIAKVLIEHPELGVVRIDGHTDTTGSAQLNMELSYHRAQAVREALIKRGVAADRLEAMGFGASRPIGDNTARDGRSKNRRVVFYHGDGPGSDPGHRPGGDTKDNTADRPGPM